MQSRWLARSATAVALVAVMATETLNPVSGPRGGSRAFSQPNTPNFSTMPSWSANWKSRR